MYIDSNGKLFHKDDGGKEIEYVYSVDNYDRGDIAYLSKGKTDLLADYLELIFFSTQTPF